MAQEDIDRQNERQRRAQEEQARREQAERERLLEQGRRSREERQQRSGQHTLLQFNLRECRNGDNSACSRALASDGLTQAQRNEISQLLSASAAEPPAAEPEQRNLLGGAPEQYWLLWAGALMAGLALLGGFRLVQDRQSRRAAFETETGKTDRKLPGQTAENAASPPVLLSAIPDAGQPESENAGGAEQQSRPADKDCRESGTEGAQQREPLPQAAVHVQAAAHRTPQQVAKSKYSSILQPKEWGILMPSPSEENKRKQIKKYFQGEDNTLAWVLVAIGVLLLLASGAGLIPSWIGLIPIAIGAILFLRDRGSFNDRQIDQWIEEDYAAHDFRARAKQLSGFPELVREPILLRGLANGALKANVFNGERIGEDGAQRSTPFAITVILCSPDQMGIYQAGVDLTTGNRVNETFLEVFYQDVTAISVNAESDTLDFNASSNSISSLKLSAADIRKGLSKRKLQANLAKLRSKFEGYVIDGSLQRDLAKVYRIDLADGDKISIPVGDGRPTRLANAQSDAEAGDEAARNMVALRAFAREKKRALLKPEAASSGALI